MQDLNRYQLAGFSERLNDAIRDSGISKKNLAKKVKISKNTLNNYANGYQVPNATILAKICTELKITSDWLLYGKE